MNTHARRTDLAAELEDAAASIESADNAHAWIAAVERVRVVASIMRAARGERPRDVAESMHVSGVLLPEDRVAGDHEKRAFARSRSRLTIDVDLAPDDDGSASGAFHLARFVGGTLDVKLRLTPPDANDERPHRVEHAGLSGVTTASATALLGAENAQGVYRAARALVTPIYEALDRGDPTAINLTHLRDLRYELDRPAPGAHSRLCGFLLAGDVQRKIHGALLCDCFPTDAIGARVERVTSEGVFVVVAGEDAAPTFVTWAALEHGAAHAPVHGIRERYGVLLAQARALKAHDDRGGRST